MKNPFRRKTRPIPPNLIANALIDLSNVHSRIAMNGITIRHEITHKPKPFPAKANLIVTDPETGIQMHGNPFPVSQNNTSWANLPRPVFLQNSSGEYVRIDSLNIRFFGDF